MDIIGIYLSITAVVVFINLVYTITIAYPGTPKAYKVFGVPIVWPLLLTILTAKALLWVYVASHKVIEDSLSTTKNSPSSDNNMEVKCVVSGRTIQPDLTDKDTCKIIAKSVEDFSKIKTY